MHKIGNEFLTCFAAVVTSVPFPRILTLTVREQILHRSPPVRSFLLARSLSPLVPFRSCLVRVAMAAASCR